MDHFKSRLEWLFFRYQSGICTEEERLEFFELVTKEENQGKLNQLLKRAIDQGDAELSLDSVKADQIYNAIISKTIVKNEKFPTARKKPIKSLLIAASVILLIGFGILQFILMSGKKVEELPKTVNSATTIKPGTDNAVLTLSDGTTIVLDTAVDGPLAQQGATKVKKIKGQIQYQETNGKGEQLYNTIGTARGNQYQVILSDGSKVWLNASSSIRFPTFFQGNERNVSITGEAYFEVAHNPKSPFKVNVNGLQITVLGTHFNVNAYDDEAAVKTTLLEGAVRLTKGNSLTVLKPGQQASVGSNDAIAVRNGVDLDEVVAWKNGSFVFNRQDIKSIMRQISRWYDVDVMYENDVTKETFSGVVSRRGNVSEALKIMEENGVKFKIEGRKIIVL